VCLAPGLHAWRWALRAGELEGASICSPPLLSKAAGLRPRGPLLVSPVRCRRLEAVFRSPITTVRFRAAIMRSPFPTCFFNTSPNVLQTRSPAAPSLMLVCPSVGDLSTAGPFPDSRPAIPVSPRTFFPFGVFRSLRISGQSDLVPGSSSSETARSPVAPRSSRLSLVPDCGSWLQVCCRYEGWPVLKPLGTNSILHPIQFHVNQMLTSGK
jgi:hypothetical protein